MTDKKPTLEYATPKRHRPRRARVLDHFVWSVMGLLWSIAAALAITLIGWILTRL